MDYFSEVCNYLSKNQVNYKENFSFSACENWLRNEICKIINFKLSDTFEETKGDWCFDEVTKIDLQIKKDKYPFLNIELKTIYHSTYGKSKNISATLNRQMKENNIGNTPSEGWVFFISNSNHSKSANINVAAEWVSNEAHTIIAKELVKFQCETKPKLLIRQELRWAKLDCHVAVSAIRFKYQ